MHGLLLEDNRVELQQNAPNPFIRAVVYPYKKPNLGEPLENTSLKCVDKPKNKKRSDFDFVEELIS